MATGLAYSGDCRIPLFGRGCPEASGRVKGGGIDYRVEVERALDELAAHLEKHLDCDAIFAEAR